MKRVSFIYHIHWQTRGGILKYIIKQQLRGKEKRGKWGRGKEVMGNKATF